MDGRRLDLKINGRGRFDSVRVDRSRMLMRTMMLRASSFCRAVCGSPSSAGRRCALVAIVLVAANAGVGTADEPTTPHPPVSAPTSPDALPPACTGVAIDLRRLLDDPGPCAIPYRATLGITATEQAVLEVHLDVKQPLPAGATAPFQIRIENTSDAPIRIPFARRCGSLPMPLRQPAGPGTFGPGHDALVRLDPLVHCPSRRYEIESVLVEVAPHGHVFLAGRLRAMTDAPPWPRDDRGFPRGPAPKPRRLARGSYTLVTEPGFAVPLDESALPPGRPNVVEPLRMAWYPRLVEPFVVR